MFIYRLDLEDPRELVESEAASRVNAYVAGHVTHDDMRRFVSAWSATKLVSQDVFERLSFYLN